MRSFTHNPDALDEIELVCPYSNCQRTFYTTNPNAIYCCDSHRGKHFRERNREQIERDRLKAKCFNENEKILATLYMKDFKVINERELIIAGFHFDWLEKASQGEDGRLCFIFVDYGLALSNDASLKYEIFKITI